MDSSIIMMDLIFTLMIHFPGQVVYLRGNHDGFSEEISKGGVSQGAAWNQALIQLRGEAYRNAMLAFYQDLPYRQLPINKIPDPQRTQRGTEEKQKKCVYFFSVSSVSSVDGF